MSGSNQKNPAKVAGGRADTENYSILQQHLTHGRTQNTEHDEIGSLGRGFGIGLYITTAP